MMDAVIDSFLTEGMEENEEERDCTDSAIRGFERTKSHV